MRFEPGWRKSVAVRTKRSDGKAEGISQRPRRGDECLVRAPHVHPGGIFVSKTTSFAGLIALTLAVSVPAAAQTKSKASEPSLEHVRELMQQAQERLNAQAQTPSPARPAQ